MNSGPAREAGAELRHELRTPLNHILGYAEMLLEDARAAGEQEFAGRLETILRTARGLVTLLAGENDLAGVQRRMGEPLAEILSQTATLRLHAAAGAQADLEKIRLAAERLLAMAGEPSGPAEPAAPGQAAATLAMQGARGCGHLLVVDDNEENRNILRRRLERQGYTVSIAGNGSEALEMVREGGFDLVLLDIMMPGIDGFEVLEEIKADARLCEIPVIMISALDEIESIVRCIEMGAEDYLPKPFDPVLLRARIGASLEKKKLRDQLVIQEKLASLGTLTAGIAHEIRNPLNFVTNFAELSSDLLQELEGTLDPEARAKADALLKDLAENLAKIGEHGKRADRIVQGMLMHARNTSGERQLADLNALVADSVNLAFHGFRAQNADFQAAVEAQYDASVGPVSVVPQDIGRVFLNIAANAFYAVHEKNRHASGEYAPGVRVRTRSLGQRVEIAIRDNGTGIPKGALDKIFSPFFTTKPAGTGTGLGLSISYDIVVREHRGEIRVESEEGEFAEFFVVLPKREQLVSER